MVTVTWITVVILELIHAQKPDFSEGLYLLDTEPIPLGVFGRFIINERSTCVSLCQIIRVSDLSAFDGRVLAYRGIDG